MGSLGLLVTTYNSAKTLPRCLESASFCEQIVVVDSGSEDGSVEIARRFGAEVFERAYRSAADQKNWALKKMRTDWVLVLDADEWLSKKTADAIRRIAKTRPNRAYRIRRLSWFLGRCVRFAWRHDWPLRLFPRNSGRWDHRLVHADFVTQLPVRRLTTPIIHHVAESLKEYLPRWMRHTELAAHDMAGRGKGSLVAGLLSASWRFLRQFILQGGFLDGRAGFCVAVLSAGSAILRHMLAKELRAAGRGAQQGPAAQTSPRSGR